MRFVTSDGIADDMAGPGEAITLVIEQSPGKSRG